MDLGYNSKGRGGSKQKLIHPKLMIYSLCAGSSFLHNNMRHFDFSKKTRHLKCINLTSNMNKKLQQDRNIFCCHLLPLHMEG